MRNDERYPGEGHHYGQGGPTNPNFSSGIGPQGEKLDNRPKKQNSFWKIVTLFMTIVAVIAVLVAVVAIKLPGIIGNSSSQATPSTATQTGPTTTQTGPSAPTVQTSTSTNYSAAKPGPGCDTSGGSWTAQGVNNITCSTSVSNITSEAWGYLYLQLPKNAAFATNNEISVKFSNIDSLNDSCFGLAEQDANAGYLAAYCVNGTWTIYSISQQGTVVQTLSSSSTAIRSNTTLSLALANNTLKFAMDSESHQTSISSIQPTQVAIAFYNNGCGNCTAVATDFNYITPAN